MTEAEAKAAVAGAVSRETLARLESYAADLVKWQKAINLVAPSTLEALWQRHFLDSLQLFELRPDGARLWLDIGTGGGFPGLVCAVAAVERAPGLRFVLIESDRRKGSFLREVARRTGARAEVLTARIEDAPPQGADVISARALAPLEKLCGYAERHLAPGGTCLFLKGKSHLAEQKDAARKWQMNCEAIPSKTEPEAVIYRIKDLSRA